MSTVAQTSSRKHTRIFKGEWESEHYVKNISYFERHILGVSTETDVRGKFELRMYEVDEQDYGMADLKLSYDGPYNNGCTKDVQLSFAKTEIDVPKILFRNHKFDVNQQFLLVMLTDSKHTEFTYRCVYPNDHGVLHVKESCVKDGFVAH
jgi:hypothetical protein